MKVMILMMTITIFLGKIREEIKVPKFWGWGSNNKGFWPEVLLMKITTDRQKFICFSRYQSYFLKLKTKKVDAIQSLTIVPDRMRQK